MLEKVKALFFLLCEELAFGRWFGCRWFSKGCEALFGILLELVFRVLLQASIDHLAELVDFIERLFVFFLHLTHDLEWTMLLAEYSVVALTVDPFNFEEVVGSASALNME